jgi:hypothetical protein
LVVFDVPIPTFPEVVIVFAEILPNDVRVCPDGTDIPAFAVINPEAVIVLAVTALAVKVPDDVRVCPDGTDIPAFAVINPEAVIVPVVTTSAFKVPELISVFPAGIVNPAFALINPDAFITLAVKVPELVSVCPEGIVSPAFAVINPEAVIVPVEIALPEANAFAVSAVPAVVGFQALLICINDDTFSNWVELNEPMRFADEGVNVDNTFPPTRNELPEAILISPPTFNLYVDVSVVPIPTFPALVILILSVAITLFVPGLVENIISPVSKPVVEVIIVPISAQL